MSGDLAEVGSVAVRMSGMKVLSGAGEQQDDASARENAVIKLLDFLF
jgi:hypothetical protein